jgi:tRNA(Arg) A34 adenosine deaminase TadA
MCLGAIYWAHIDKIYYGANQLDAASVDFDDSFIYRELELTPDKRNKPVENILHDEAQAPFRAWQEKEDKIRY